MFWGWKYGLLERSATCCIGVACIVEISSICSCRFVLLQEVGRLTLHIVWLDVKLGLGGCGLLKFAGLGRSGSGFVEEFGDMM